jgi:hypothetical protein
VYNAYPAGYAPHTFANILKMTLKEAKKRIKAYIDKCDNYKIGNTKVIKDMTLDIALIFGRDSEQYSKLLGFELFDLNIGFDMDSVLNKAKGLREFLNLCLHELEYTGKVYKPKKSNLLSDNSNASLISVIFAISLVVFGVGFYFGTEKTNKDLINSAKEAIELRDSLLPRYRTIK